MAIWGREPLVDRFISFLAIEKTCKGVGQKRRFEHG